MSSGDPSMRLFFKSLIIIYNRFLKISHFIANKITTAQINMVIYYYNFLILITYNLKIRHTLYIFYKHKLALLIENLNRHFNML